MYIVTDQVCKWRQRKHKKHMVSMFSRCLIMAPLVLIGTVGIALAAPSGGVITGGSGGIETSGSATNISQTSPRLDINWNTFSTDVHESINFAQPSSESIALNRVIGGVPSELRGALNANGRVFILNDSGITFFGTSQVNVGALLATTATSISTDGGSFSFSGAGYGTVLNDGSIHVSDGGFAVLAAPYVANTGFIQANLGTIDLASANDFTVDFRGDGLIGFTISKSTLDGIAEAGKALGVDNTGTLLAGSGAIGISAGAASSIVQSVVNLDGIVDASSFGVGADGGTVLVASVGDINIGGEVHADGGVSGNGGTVITWADGTNRFESGAVITARGGAEAGDGGFIEVSGNDVRVRGTANASAPNGAAGTFLIDPWDMIIKDGAGTDTVDMATVFEQNIEATSVGGTNVDLVADNSITMENLIDDVLQGGSGDISMSITSPSCSDCAITFADPNDKIATTGGAITMTANDGTGGEGGPGLGTIRVGHLETLGTGANITLTAGLGGITAGNLCAGGTADACGVARTNNPGDITLSTTGSIETLDVTIYAEDTDSASAYLTMTAGGDITTGNISLTAKDPSWSVDNATAFANLTAGGSVAMESASVIAEGEKSVTAELNVTATAGDITVTPLLPAAAINVSATALDGGSDSANADADITLNAGNDIKINGDVEVNAGATNNVDSSATAEARLYVSAGHDIEITGATTSVVASAAFGTSNLNANSASADASADFWAGNNLTLGGFTVYATAGLNTDAPNARDANAEANLSAGADHDIITTSPTFVIAEASLATSGTDEADADADASFSADNDISLTGASTSPAVTVKATATNTGLGGIADADDDANANLSVSAVNDVNITGGVLVSAVSTLDGSALDSAAADADASFYGNNITINGDVKVEATATNSAAVPVEGSCYYYYGYCGSGAEASAELYMSTGGEGGGDITINGNTLVTASATVEGEATGSADARASAEIYGNNIIVTGDLSVIADAVSNATGASDASASADLYVEAGNDLTITGDTLVAANAEVADGSGSASASATADLYAGHNVSVTGDITVEANALTGISDASSASASAELYVDAGNDLTITGDLLVSAKAMGAATESASASASAELYSGGDMTVNGDITVEAIAENTSGSDATADADLYMQAYEGDVNIAGDILVRSEATLGASGTDSASASASAEIYGYDVNITGDVTVTAVAVNNGTEASDASASAELYIGAYNDLTITGNTLVTADATTAGSSYGEASAFAYLEAIASVGDLNITGDIDVKADAAVGSGGSYDASASAMAVALLTGGNDVNIITGSGTIDVAANAVNDGSGSASAAAVLVAAAGVDGNDLTGLAEELTYGYIPEFDFSSYFGEGNLNITGDVKVTGRADSAYSSADAVAVALMGAGNDTTILTDPITVLAEAKSGTGYSYPDGYDGYGYGNADAFSYLLCEAGIADIYEEGQSGSLYITGDISSTALATGTGYYNYYTADAFTGLYAADDITVLGADPLAYAPTAPGAEHARVQAKESGFDEASYYGDGGEGYYTAELEIKAGGTVSIEPKPLSVIDDEHEVVLSLETRKVEPIEPLGPGKDPLSFDADGLVSWATGAGVTSPSGGFMVTPDAEGAIARGVDPTTILPAPAAGGIGLSSGLDAYSVGGPDYCDQVVNGYCLPAEGVKKIK